MFMRNKYVEERFPRYFIFGESEDSVDLATSSDMTRATVSRDHAANLIQDREAAIDMLSQLALKLSEVAPEEFDKIWGYHKK